MDHTKQTAPNAPVVKPPGKDWLQKLPREECALCWRGEEAHLYQPALRHSHQRRSHKKSTEWIGKLPFQWPEWETAGDFRTQLRFRVWLMVLCRRQAKDIWLALEDTNLCAIHIKCFIIVPQDMHSADMGKVPKKPLKGNLLTSKINK